MIETDIEDSILSSFLYASDIAKDIEHAFLMDEDVFTGEYRKRVVKKINEVYNTDDYYSFLSYKLECSVKGTKLEHDHILIMSQTPMPFKLAKKYYDDLESKYFHKKITSI